MSFLTTLNQNIAMATPGIRVLRSVYNSQPKTWTRFFDLTKSEKHYEVTTQFRMMGAAQRIAEGAQVPVSTFSTNGQKTFNFNTYSLEVNVSRILLQDNLYPAEIPQLGEAFIQSMVEAINLEAAAFISNAWDSTISVGWDNLPALSEVHPVQGGTFSNTTSVVSAFNYQTLTDIIVKQARIKAANGFYVGNIEAKCLMIAPENAPQALSILESYFSPGSAFLTRNPANAMQYIKEGIITNPYISPNIVAIRTSQPGMYFWDRWSFDVAQQPNVSTWSLLTAAFMRCLIDFDDPRSIVGFKTTGYVF